jgi:hypothetical protein
MTLYSYIFPISLFWKSFVPKEAWKGSSVCARAIIKTRPEASRKVHNASWLLRSCYLHLLHNLWVCSAGLEPADFGRFGLGPVWYSFMSGFTSSFTTSIVKRPALCPASLKTLSHRVKHMVKLQKHSSPLLMKLLMKLFSKKQLYRWSWAVPNRALFALTNHYWFCRNLPEFLPAEHTLWFVPSASRNAVSQWQCIIAKGTVPAASSQFRKHCELAMWIRLMSELAGA